MNLISSKLYLTLFILYSLTIQVLVNDAPAFLFTGALILFILLNTNDILNQLDKDFFILLIPITFSCIINLSLELLFYYICFYGMFFLNRKIEFSSTFFIIIISISIFYFLIQSQFFSGEHARGIIPFLSDHNKTPSYSINLYENLTITATSVFGLVLFLFGISKNKILFILIGLYFGIFGASRLVSILMFYSFLTTYLVKNKITIILLAVLTFSLPFLLLLTLELIPEKFIFLISKERSNYYYLEEPRILTAIEYISIIKKSPLFGLGSIDFRALFEAKDLPFSELQFFLRAAETGIISSVLSLWFFSKRFWKSLKKDYILESNVYFTIIMCSFYYGSFMYAYNFIFLLLISLLHVRKSKNINGLKILLPVLSSWRTSKID